MFAPSLAGHLIAVVAKLMQPTHDAKQAVYQAHRREWATAHDRPYNQNPTGQSPR